MLNRLLAFLKKDLLMETSYKLAFLLNILHIFITIFSYFFIDKLFGYRIVGHLQEFGVSYFSYVLVSMAFFSYIGVGLGSFSNRIRMEQMQGTLEAILLTPTRISTFLLALTMWNFCFATLDVFIYVLFGVFLFKIDFGNINWLSALTVLILTVTSFSSLGILSASFIMVFKRGNPIAWVMNNLQGLIGGVYFPVTVMPGWLQFLGKFLPITYSIKAIELAIYKGAGLNQLGKEIGFLLLFTCLLLPLSFASFRYALKKARRQGSLLQY